MAKKYSARDKEFREGKVYSITNFVILDTSSPNPDGIDINKPFVFDGMVMCTCLRGKSRVRLNYKELDIGEGQILTIMPNQIIRMLEQSDDFFCELLFFPIDFIADYPSPSDYDLLFRFNEQQCITVPKEVMQSLLELHALIVKHYHITERAYNKEIVKSLLYTLLLMVLSIYETNAKDCSIARTQSRKEELTDKFFHFLFKHFKEERSVSFYADRLYITPKYLTTVVKEVTGHSILNWINEIVVIGLKTYLRTTNLSILQLSEEFHFANPSFFGRYFKQHTGMTPMQYRHGVEKICE